MPRNAGAIQVEFSGTSGVLDKEAKHANAVLDQYGDVVSRVQRQAAQLVNPTQKAADATRDVASASQRAAAQIDDAASSTRRMNDAVKLTGRNGGNFNQLLFSMGDAVGDARYGLLGMGNNLAFVGERLTETMSRGTSFKQLMAGIGSSLMGAGGIVLGMQALIALGPEIIDFFSDSGDAASGFRKEVKKAAEEATEAILQLETNIGGVTFDPIEIPGAITTVEGQLGGLRATRGNIQSEIQELETRLRAFQTSRGRAAGPLANRLTKRIEQTKALLATERESLKTTNEKIARQESYLSKLETARDNFSDQVQAQSDLVELGGTRIKQAEGVADAAGDLQDRLKAILSLANKASKVGIMAGGRIQGLDEIAKNAQKATEARRNRIDTGALEMVPLNPKALADAQAAQEEYLASLNDTLSRGEILMAHFAQETQYILGDAIASASRQFGQEFAGSVMGLLQGPDEALMASMEERKLRLQDQLNAVRESLQEGEISHAMYAARVKSIHAELAETNKQLAYETANVFEQVFRSAGNFIENIAQQVLAEVTSIMVEMAALAALRAVFTGGSSVLLDSAIPGGGAFGGVLASVQQAQPQVPKLPATPSSPVTVQVNTSTMRVENDAILASVRAGLATEAERGEGDGTL